MLLAQTFIAFVAMNIEALTGLPAGNNSGTALAVDGVSEALHG